MTVTESPSPALFRPEPWYRNLTVLDRIAFYVASAALIGEVVHLSQQSSTVTPPVGWVGLVLAAIGVAISRKHAWAGLAVILGAAVLDGAGGWDPLTIWTIAVFIVFGATVKGMSPVWGGLVTTVFTTLSAVLAFGLELTQPEVSVAVAASVAGAATGSALRSQRQYWRALEDRTRDAVLTREAEAERRVTEERLRIARDLHDIVGHEVAVVSVHLGVVEVSLPAGATKAKDALNRARDSVQAVLSETQDILRILRSDPPDADEDSGPTPGIREIPSLIQSYEALGLSIEARIDTASNHFDAALDTAVYRIVQEALTNAHRYGDGKVELQVTANYQTVTVQASNRPSPDRTGGGTGFGLVGMAERARSAGGTITVNDHDPDRFTVTAVLRLDGKAPQ